MAIGLDVGRFGANTERNNDFTDGPAGLLGVEEFFCLAPTTVAVTIELHRGDFFDSVAATLLSDLFWRSRILELSEYLSRVIIVRGLGDVLRGAAATVVGGVGGPVGGVGGPVSGGGALPGDGDADVDSE